MSDTMTAVAVRDGIDFAGLIDMATFADTAAAKAAGKVNPWRYETNAFTAFLRASCAKDPASGLVAYDAEIRTRGLSAAAVNKRLSAAKRAVRQLVDLYGGSMTNEQTARVEQTLRKIKPIKRDSRPQTEKFMSKDEARAFLAGCRDETARLAVLFMANTGLRVSELLSIRLRNIKQGHDGYTVTVVGKGQRERSVMPPAELVDECLRHFKGKVYLFEHDGRPFDRCSLTTRIRRASLATIGRPISAHVARHSYASWLLAQGISINKVSELLGHASISTTDRFYNHTRATREDARISL